MNLLNRKALLTSSFFFFFKFKKTHGPMFFVLLTAHGDQRTEQNSRGETSYHHISYTYICIYDEHANPLSCHFLPFIIIWLLVIKVVYLICPKFQNSIESVEIFTLLKLLVEAYQYHLMWSWALYAMHL